MTGLPPEEMAVRPMRLATTSSGPSTALGIRFVSGEHMATAVAGPAADSFSMAASGAGPILPTPTEAEAHDVAAIFVDELSRM